MDANTTLTRDDYLKIYSAIIQGKAVIYDLPDSKTNSLVYDKMDAAQRLLKDRYLIGGPRG